MLGRCCGKIVLALHVKDATHVTVTVTVRRVTVTVTKSVGWDCVTVRRVTGHVAKSCLAYCVLALHKQLVASASEARKKVVVAYQVGEFKNVIRFFVKIYCFLLASANLALHELLVLLLASCAALLSSVAKQ